MTRIMRMLIVITKAFFYVGKCIEIKINKAWGMKTG